MSPKARYLLRPEAEKHRLLAHTEEFAMACDAAELEMQSIMSRTDNTESSAAARQRIIGAKMFRDMLETIADLPKELEPPKSQIDYRA